MDIITFDAILSKASVMLGFEKEKYTFEYTETENVYVSLKNGHVTVGGACITDYYRGFMLFYNEIKKGNGEFEIRQRRHFETLGFSLDLSRNGVIRVESIKKIIDVMALLGFNVLKLYMEDVFDLPGYPRFGYRRGKYSHEELKEIDDYAYSMGIEAIPAIQTLGHLSQYLRYGEAKDLRENGAVLLCGSEKTYEFIEAIVKTMRKCFRTKRLAVNCDEAGGVGNKKIKMEKRYLVAYDELIIPHLEKIREITAKYDFRPIVDGDLFYGHLGKGYYDFDFMADEKRKSEIPDLDIIYWDYYHMEYSDYETLLKGHKSLRDEIMFLGGIWIWSGQLPQVDFTIKSMTPAMQVCLDYGVKDVWAATFGDDGNETAIAFAIPSLLVFSEHCFRGKECTEEIIYELSENVLRLDMNAFRALSNYHYPWVNEIEKKEYIWPNYMGKKIFYTDLFYNMTETYKLSDILTEHRAALETIKDAGKGTPWEKYYDYARLIFEITTEKIGLILKVRKAYEEKNINSLAGMVSEIVKLKEKYITLMEMHEKQWLDTYKAFGWEELGGRYAWVISRLDYAARTIGKYVKGELNAIEELEFDFVEAREGCHSCGGVVTFAMIKSSGL